MGHVGPERTLALLQNRCYWPNLANEVRYYIRRCRRCTLRKTRDPRTRAPLTNIKTQRPLELVCMDFLSLEASAGGIENILVITDHFTRHAQAFPTRDQTAITVAKTLWSRYIVHYGIPERIHSDQGKCFDAAVIQELTKLLGMGKSRTTPYHPQGNGMTERFNSTLLNMLGTLHPSQKSHWKDHVESLAHAYNCTEHTSTGFSPFYPMFLRSPKVPVDLMLGNTDNNEECDDETEYVRRLRQCLKEAYQAAKHNADKARRKQKLTHDRKARDTEFLVGQKVLVANKSLRGRHKIADRWEPTPHTIVKKLPGLHVYVARNDQTGKERTLHRNLLTTCTFAHDQDAPLHSDDEDYHTANEDDEDTDDETNISIGTPSNDASSDSDLEPNLACSDTEIKARQYPKRQRRPPNRLDY